MELAGAQRLAVLYEDYGSYFFTGLGVESARLARETFGYDVLLNRSLTPNTTDGTSVNATELEAALAEVVLAKPDVLLLSMRQQLWEPTLAALSAARPKAPLGDAAPPAGGGHVFSGVWFQGASQKEGGVDCMGFNASCAFVTGGTQMSSDEALDAYEDALLGSGKTYRWLREQSGHMAAFDASLALVDFPDGAMVPSTVAQALQQVFRFRALTSPTRPLADPTDYELLRSYLASGDLVATTFYGEVRFDAYGQNTGRKPTTLQVASDGVARVVFPVSIEAVERKVFDFPAPAALAECDAASALVNYADECLLCEPLECCDACWPPPPSPPPPSPGVRLGGLFQHSTAKVGRFMAFVMAVQEINNSTDLLPQHVLRFAVQDSACDAGTALVGAHHLAQTAFSGLGTDAIIGAACSGGSG